MNPLIVIGLIVAVPAILITLVGANAGMVFLSLCVGSLLSSFVGDAALDMVQTLVSGYNPTTQAFVQLGLLLLPVLLTLLFLGRSVFGSSKLMNLFPAILTGIMILFLAVPLLPEGTRYGIYGTQVWQEIIKYQALFIGAVCLFSLGQLWSNGRPAKDKKSKHKR